MNLNSKNIEYILFKRSPVIIIAFLFVLFAVALPFSFVLLEVYTYGDQVYYHKFYADIYGLNFSELPVVAKNVIDSNEPLAWLVFWVGSNLGIYKNLWMTMLNMVLYLGLLILLLKNKAPWYVFFLICTNFYLIVLVTSAERLKISYIFIIYGFLLSGYRRYLLFLLTPLCHFQSAILLTGFVGFLSRDVFLKITNSLRINSHALKISFVFFFTAGGFFYFFRNSIISKVNFYYNYNINVVDSLMKFFVLLTIGILISSNKFRMLLSLLPVFIALVIVGGDRINMIAFTMVFGILMYERRLKHPLFILLLTYFSVKSIGFIDNILLYGNGFNAP